MHGLVHAAAVGHEPVVDAPQRGQHAALDAGFFGYFSNGCLFGRLTEFDVALGQRPQHPSAPVDAADQGGDLRVARSVEPVDDQPAGGCLVDRAQPLRPAAGPARSARFGGCRIAVYLTVGLLLGRSRSATTAAPSPAPTWFALFAVRHPSDSSWHGMLSWTYSPLGGCAMVITDCVSSERAYRPGDDESGNEDQE